MEKVTGIGGVFYRAKDAEALRAFYRDKLGVSIEAWGGTSFTWRDARDASVTGATVWSTFKDDTDYFAPSASRFMINYRVRDLDRMRAQLIEAGVSVDERVESSEYGRFGWAHDPEGNKIELWEPPSTERSGTPYWVVDAFTERAFSGNPAAVCPLDAFLPDETLLSIARENALSETAFFVPRDGGSAEAPAYDLRWFTPGVEVDLCGHATLASAHVVLTVLSPSAGSVVFHTRSGPLTVTREGEALAMDFPSRPAEVVAAGPDLAAALGKAPVETLRAGASWVCIFDHAADVRALTPDVAALGKLDASAVMVTARGDGADADVDFVSRFFAPQKGVPEDPVTGSAHCTLAPLWASRLGKTELEARQVSARGGELRCDVRGERVVLTGRAVTVKAGVLLAV